MDKPLLIPTKHVNITGVNIKPKRYQFGFLTVEPLGHEGIGADVTYLF